MMSFTLLLLSCNINSYFSVLEMLYITCKDNRRHFQQTGANGIQNNNTHSHWDPDRDPHAWSQISRSFQSYNSQLQIPGSLPSPSPCKDSHIHVKRSGCLSSPLGYKSRTLVSLRGFMMQCHYFLAVKVSFIRVYLFEAQFPSASKAYSVVNSIV